MAIISPLPDQPKESLFDRFVSYASPPVSPIPYQPQSALNQAVEAFAEAKRLQAKQALQNALIFLQNILQQRTSSTQQTVPSPTPLPQLPRVGGYTQAQYEQAIREGFRNWGDLPVSALSNVYARAPFSAPIFQKYPFLLAAQSIAETSGGKPFDPKTKSGMTYSNNPQNWGIRPQRAGLYSPQSMEQVVLDAMSGIGGRTLEQGFTPEQVRTSSYYEPFRQSQDLYDLAKVYAPPTENDTQKYVRDLQDIMNVFNQKLKLQQLANL